MLTNGAPSAGAVGAGHVVVLDDVSHSDLRCAECVPPVVRELVSATIAAAADLRRADMKVEAVASEALSAPLASGQREPLGWHPTPLAYERCMQSCSNVQAAYFSNQEYHSDILRDQCFLSADEARCIDGWRGGRSDQPELGELESRSEGHGLGFETHGRVCARVDQDACTTMVEMFRNLPTIGRDLLASPWR